MEFKHGRDIELEGIIKFKQTIDGFCKIKNIKNYQIVDVRDNRNYQILDIDYLVEFDSDSLSIEVKSSSYTYGYIFIENVSNSNTCSLGYIYQTNSDYLVYTFNDSKILYLNTYQLREWYDINKSKYTTIHTNTNIGNKILYHSEGNLIPIKDIKIMDKTIFDLCL